MTNICYWSCSVNVLRTLPLVWNILLPVAFSNKYREQRWIRCCQKMSQWEKVRFSHKPWKAKVGGNVFDTLTSRIWLKRATIRGCFQSHHLGDAGSSIRDYVLRGQNDSHRHHTSSCRRTRGNIRNSVFACEIQEQHVEKHCVTIEVARKKSSGFDLIIIH